jgi:YbbR domain-containing protein
VKLSWPTQFGALLVVALLLWLAAFGISYQSFKIELTPAIINLPAGLAIAENPGPITATIRARVGAAYRLRSSGLVTAELDLVAAAPGDYSIKPEVTVALADAWLVNAQPGSISVRLVPAVTKQVSLVVEPVGFPAAGYSLGDMAVTPTAVDITGPASVLDSISEAQVPVNVKGKRANLTVFGTPVVKDADGRNLINISFLPSQVSVAVGIKAGDSFKTVGLTPAFTGSLVPGHWVSYIEFEPPTLTIRGSAEKLAGIESLTTTPIKLTDRAADFTDKVSAELPLGVVLVSPNLVNVKVKVVTSTNNRILVLLPSYTNITEGMSVTSVNPPTVSVVLSGPADQLASLSRANVSLDLDLRGELTGANMVTLGKEMFKVPENIEVISWEPITLEVNLTKS